jgi:hypothetical protein
MQLLKCGPHRPTAHPPPVLVTLIVYKPTAYASPPLLSTYTRTATTAFAATGFHVLWYVDPSVLLVGCQAPLVHESVPCVRSFQSTRVRMAYIAYPETWTSPVDDAIATSTQPIPVAVASIHPTVQRPQFGQFVLDLKLFKLVPLTVPELAVICPALGPNKVVQQFDCCALNVTVSMAISLS